ncbi:hypothetical protein [Coleofasciculus sp. FACHB-SPT9]|uniref:hypothetical protein n=1 Tax=Cyanophyceae TaxID=3028117 RepID=UPI0016881513|nr:hypothetical protein [Coleofasciculus sp. FACHB-SPT9]MBD1892917.1 hypothetical protein [Coleofasciculus sp. FACHB-SPT9]
MNKSYLTKCIECGVSVSSVAYECPQCGTKKPHGIPCKICKKPAQLSKAIKRIKINSVFYEPLNRPEELVKSEEIYFFHQNCLNLVHEVLAYCSLCGYTITQTCSSCPKCGEWWQNDKCAYCHEPILKGFAFIESTGAKYHNVYAEGAKYHNVCAEILKPEWEKEKINRQKEQEKLRQQDEIKAREEQEKRRQQLKLDREISNQLEQRRREQEEERKRKEDLNKFILLCIVLIIFFVGIYLRNQSSSVTYSFLGGIHMSFWYSYYLTKYSIRSGGGLSILIMIFLSFPASFLAACFSGPILIGIYCLIYIGTPIENLVRPEYISSWLNNGCLIGLVVGSIYSVITKAYND